MTKRYKSEIEELDQRIAKVKEKQVTEEELLQQGELIWARNPPLLFYKSLLMAKTARCQALLRRVNSNSRPSFSFFNLFESRS